MAKIITKWPTGSNYICNPPVVDTDIDTVVLVESLSESRASFLEDGWKLCGEEYNALEQNWYAIRKGKDNYICIEDIVLYQRWVTATELAKELNLLKKEDRILLFDVIVNGRDMW